MAGDKSECATVAARTRSETFMAILPICDGNLAPCVVITREF
jgi:hypothetical protein